MSTRSRGSGFPGLAMTPPSLVTSRDGHLVVAEAGGTPRRSQWKKSMMTAVARLKRSVSPQSYKQRTTLKAALPPEASQHPEPSRTTGANAGGGVRKPRSKRKPSSQPQSTRGRSPRKGAAAPSPVGARLHQLAAKKKQADMAARARQRAQQRSPAHAEAPQVPTGPSQEELDERALAAQAKAREQACAELEVSGLRMCDASVCGARPSRNVRALLS